MSTKVPPYGVLWTGRQETDPVIFYHIRNDASYQTLVQYLACWPQWEKSFTWTSRRWMGYQHELAHKGAPWILYDETADGWRVSTTVAPWDA